MHMSNSNSLKNLVIKLFHILNIQILKFTNKILNKNCIVLNNQTNTFLLKKTINSKRPRVPLSPHTFNIFSYPFFHIFYIQSKLHRLILYTFSSQCRKTLWKFPSRRMFFLHFKRPVSSHIFMQIKTVITFVFRAGEASFSSSFPVQRNYFHF